MTSIELKRVTKNFRDTISAISFQVLNGIDLRVEQGSFISIMGPSGAGKTTLLNIIGGNLRPSSGEIYVGSMAIHHMNEFELEQYRRSFCGFLWQEAEDNLLPQLSIKQNLIQGMRIGGYPVNKREQRIDDLLSRFEILDRKDFKITKISGGEALRASLAMSLANEPSLLLADEPTGELDSETSVLIIDYLREISEELGMTIITMTHDRLFEPRVDRTYRLNDGSIAAVNLSSDLDKRISYMNSFGQIQIPKKFRDKYNYGRLVEVVENEEGRSLTIRPYNQKDSD